MAKGVKKPALLLKEAAVAYRVSPKVRMLTSLPPSQKSIQQDAHSPVKVWLGGAKVIAGKLHTDFDFIMAGAAGLPKAAADQLAASLGISRKSMAEDILDLSVKTLERKAVTDKLDKRTSSHILEIAKLLQHAFEVFEDEEKLRRWIATENRALNNLKPLQLLDTLTGITLVHTILGRIEEGVYS